MKTARTILITAAAAVVFGLCGAASAELPGPVAHWGFDEGAGVVAYDSAGDNDGAIVGAQWADGFIGGALSFDGTNDYVEAASCEELKLNLAGTVSAWIKPEGLYRHSIVSKRGSLEAGGIYENYWLTLGTYNQCTFGIADGSNWVYATIAKEDLAVDAWQHVAGTWDPCEVRIYLDGRLIDAQPNTTVSDLIRSDACPLRVGYHHVDGWFFDGLIDDVRIYNVALSAAEVEQLYGQEPNDGLVAHWKFDEASGSTAYDSGGNNDGVVYGAQWADGVLDGALNFDGLNNYVEAASSEELKLNSAGAVSVWVKLRDLYEQSIVKKQSVSEAGNKNVNYWLVFGMYNRAITIGDGSDYVYASIPEGELLVNTWQHVVGTWDSSEIQIYLNGNLRDTQPNTLSDLIRSDTYPVRIGYDSWTGWGLDGLIDDVRIYDVALSAAEIEGLYEADPQVPESEVYHVDKAGGSDLNDGLSRATAFATIQKGIDSSVAGGEVLVWPGVYSQAINFLGKAITVRSAGDAAAIEAPGQDAVTFHSGEGAESVLKNFVIRNSGLGISANYGSSPTVTNVTIVDNDFGIAAYEDSNPDISNCILWDNRDGDLWGCQARYSFVEQEIETGPVDGLIAHWKFDEGRGTTAGDSAGDNDGAINGAQWVVGQLSGALSFDGADDYVSIPDADIFDFNDGDVSISMWFKTSVYADQTLMKLRQYDDDPHLEVYNSTTYGNLGTRAMPTGEAGAIVAYNAGRVDDGGWHHAAVSLENGSTGGYKLYLDGTLIGMTTFSGRLRDWNAIAIGSDAGGDGYFNGSIDDVRIYNKAISAFDAYLLYDMSREGPIAHWKFDEGAGSIAYDSAGGNDGVIYGAQWATGPLDGALEFDGANDYLEAASSEELKLNLSGTISAWIRPRDLYRRSIVSKRASSEAGAKYENYFLTLGTYNQCSMMIADGCNSPSATIPEEDLAVDLWQHVTGTWDSREIRIYLDGRLIDAQPNTTVSDLVRSDACPLRIGYHHVLDGWYFVGLIDDVRIYDRALSAGEVELLYGGGVIGRDDTGSLRPLFVNAGAGDYHLLSERGRYWPEHNVWVLDKISSPCIDAGDPAIEPVREPMPNGGAINMGAFGATEYASMSEWPIFSDYDRNGRSDFRDFAIFCDEWLTALPWAE